MQVLSIHWFAYFQPDLRSVQLRWSNLESMSSLLENDNVKCKKSGMPLMGIRTTLLFHQNEVVSTRQIEESESNCKVFNVIHVLGVNTNKEGGWKRFMVDYKPSVCNHFNLSQNVDYSFMNAVSIFCPSFCLVLAALWPWIRNEILEQFIYGTVGDSACDFHIWLLDLFI